MGDAVAQCLPVCTVPIMIVWMGRQPGACAADVYSSVGDKGRRKHLALLDT